MADRFGNRMSIILFAEHAAILLPSTSIRVKYGNKIG